MGSRSLLLLLALAGAATARDRIAFIEFYGYKGFDVEAVRKALLFHEGDPVSNAIKPQARGTVKRLTGKDATEVERVCCVNDGDTAVFIGLPGASSQTFTFNAEPKQNVRLSPELNALYRMMEQAEEAAVQKGATEEDGSPGYRLLKEPAARTAELRVRQYALRHEAELLHVLESSASGKQRSIAADALGYGDRSPRQVAALVHAARDPDGAVRNDATRALGEILRADPSAAAQVQPDTFIDMVRSGIWGDRNKSSVVLSYLTESRDPQLLNRLKSQAWDALMEMARWRATGWASAPRTVLARIAGIPEDRIMQLAFGPVHSFLDALNR